MGNLSVQAGKFAQSGVSIKMIAKLAISAGLLAWLLSKIPIASLCDSLARCQWPSLVMSFIAVNLCMLVSVLKWRPLLSVQRIEIPFTRLLSAYYAGLFANNFLPSSIGGDALRVYDVARWSGKTKEAAASVIMERLLASLALALTAAAALVLVTKMGGSSYIFKVVGGLVALCLGLLGILFCYPFRENGRVGQWLCRLGSYRKHPHTLGKVLLYSFLFQGLLVLANIFIFQAMGAEVPLLKHFLFIPVIMATSMLPLSINGIGIREGMYVMLYGRAGMEPGAAIICSLVFFVLVTVTSLAGGVILALRK